MDGTPAEEGQAKEWERVAGLSKELNINCWCLADSRITKDNSSIMNIPQERGLAVFISNVLFFDAPMSGKILSSTDKLNESISAK